VYTVYISVHLSLFIVFCFVFVFIFLLFSCVDTFNKHLLLQQW